jgi:GNAT superfamily N-acetyltransferase
MSLEYALDKYPFVTKLRDGTECVLRPLGKRDATRLQKFLLSVPEEERLFIKQNPRNRALVEDWCRNLDFQRNLPLLMLDGAKVIGEATLHQRGGGWKRHIGLLTVLTHPGYRGRDVAKILVRELLDIARQLGLKKLEAELNGERKVAILALEQLGFRELYRLADHVLDMQCVSHDYVVMGIDLVTDEEYTAGQ